MMASTGCRLYLVSPSKVDALRFSEQLKAAFDGGDVSCLQLRLKDRDDTEVLRAAELLAPICHRYDAPLLINDRPDLAAASDSDGVHIGQEDATFEESRELLGPDKIIGVTCHDSRDLAITAAENGADYVAFGAFYRTGTKSAKTRAVPDILKWVRGYPADSDRCHRWHHTTELSSADSSGRGFSGRHLGRMGPRTRTDGRSPCLQ